MRPTEAGRSRYSGLRRALCAGRRGVEVGLSEFAESVPLRYYRQYCGFPNASRASYGRVYGSTAAPLSSAASSSASEASANASNRAAPSASSSAPSVSEAELSGAARGVDCLPTADEMTRQLSSLGSKLRC
jgi:hypothetical protein